MYLHLLYLDVHASPLEHDTCAEWYMRGGVGDWCKEWHWIANQEIHVIVLLHLHFREPWGKASPCPNEDRLWELLSSFYTIECHNSDQHRTSQLWGQAIDQEVFLPHLCCHHSIHLLNSRVSTVEREIFQDLEKKQGKWFHWKTEAYRSHTFVVSFSFFSH